MPITQNPIWKTRAWELYSLEMESLGKPVKFGTYSTGPEWVEVLESLQIVTADFRKLRRMKPLERRKLLQRLHAIDLRKRALRAREAAKRAEQAA